MCDIISKCIRDIGEAIRNGRVVLFVGTGISYDSPSNIPLADDVTNNILFLMCHENGSLQKLVFGKDTPTERDTPDGIINVYRKITEDINKSLGKDYSKRHGYERWAKKRSIRMEVLLQFVWNVIKEEVLRVLKPFNKAPPNKYHYFLAKAIESGNDIITTNYDDLIEKACCKLKISPKGFYYSEETFGEWLGDEKSGCLFKIHGTLHDLDKNDKGESVIATLSEISGGLSKNKREVLLRLLEKKIGIFMGYSFSNYFDISPVLKDLTGVEIVYYIDYKPNMPNLKCHYIPVADSENYYFNHRPVVRISGTTSFLRDQIIDYLCWNSYLKDCNGATDIPKDFYLREISNFIFSLSFGDKARIIAQVFTNLGLGEKAVQTLDNISYNNDSLKQSYLFIDHANAYSTWGKTTKSLGLLNKALKNLNSFKKKELDCYFSYCMVLINIGRDNRRRWNFEKAVSCFQKAIKMLSHCPFELDESKKAKVLKLQLLAYDYLGDVPITIAEQIFAQLNLKIFVRYYFKKAEKIYQVRGKIENELEKTGVKSCHFDGEELYQRRLKTIGQFLYGNRTDIDPIKRYTEIDNMVGRIVGLADVSHTLLAKGEISEAEQNLMEAKIIADNICSPWDKMKLTRQLGMIKEKHRKNFLKSREYYTKSYQALLGIERCRFTICMKIFLKGKILLSTLKEWAPNFI